MFEVVCWRPDQPKVVRACVTALRCLMRVGFRSSTNTHACVRGGATHLYLLTPASTRADALESMCRLDGTLAYFFPKEDLVRRCQAAGLAAEYCKYVCVTNKNRKTGQELRRVFVQGSFRKCAA